MSPTYRVLATWEQLPAGWQHLDSVGVHTDADDNVYLLTREKARVTVYRRDGSFLRSWGEDLLTERTHGLTVGPDGRVYVVDDGAHCVYIFSSAGALLQTIGTPGKASDTGYDGSLKSIRGGGPFNRPTNLAIGPSGDLYVTDGYGNCKVHRFSAQGNLIQSWGTPGTSPGQFNLPHGIAVAPDGRVFVADRENDRIQIFTADGRHLATWTDVQRPTNVRIDRHGRLFVSELWWRVGQESQVHGPIVSDRAGRVTVFTDEGRVLTRFGDSSSRRAEPGFFVAPHDLCVDSRGDLYVAEVTQTFGVRPGQVPAGTHNFQKFEVIG